MTAQVRFIDAISEGLRTAMDADDAVVIIGEDVTFGGPVGATKGQVEEFGSGRVRDTPISEATVMGVAIGAALSGLRPVVEIMFIDFITLAMDQLVNHAAKFHFMTGGQLTVPLTLRVQGGINGRFGAHHSQSLESWLVHTPGLKVVAPAFPGDARRLLQVAIKDDNPVVFIEHRGLYWMKGPLGGTDPTSGALVRREGTDVTIISYSKMLHAALSAADTLDAAGVAAEVVDLRWLSPLDLDTVVGSVRKTGRAIIAHEAVTQGGVGAELVASIQTAAFENLVAPIERVGAPFAPIGASPELEDAFSPRAEDIVEAALRTMKRGD